MTPLPPALGGSALMAWRLDQAIFASTWDSGEGAFRFGGRWNSPGVRAVYASLDPATAILEVAVHKGFRILDTVAHVLTGVEITDTSTFQVITHQDVPNPNWLRPGPTSAGQRAFGDALLRRNRFVVIPSAVSMHSWNLIFVPANAVGAYVPKHRERFALDTRLHPPV